MNTDKYYLLIYWIHSCLEIKKHDLEITETTTVENFRDSPKNKKHCDEIFDYSLERWNYELSNNQMCNGINLLLNKIK